MLRPQLLVSLILPLVIAVIILSTRTDDFSDAVSNKYGSDWRELYQAGQLIFTSDAVKIYHATSEEEAAWRLAKGETIAHLLYSPLMALFMVPFGVFSHETGFLLWRILTISCMAVVGVVLGSSLKSWAWRLCVLLCVLGWSPILINLRLGQTGALMAALLAGVCLLFLEDRVKGLIAGGVIALKLGLALGPGFLAWEEGNKGLVAFALSFGLAILLPFVVFGSDAVTALRGWIGNVNTMREFELSQGDLMSQSLIRLIPGSQRIEQGILVGLIGAMTLLISKVRQTLGWEATAGLALMAGLLLTPHSQIYDWGVAFVALAFVRRSRVMWQGCEDWVADLAVGSSAVLLFLLGEYGMKHFDSDPQAVTLWALAFCAGIVLVAFLRSRQDSTEVTERLAGEPAA